MNKSKGMGQLVMTRGLSDTIADNTEFAKEITKSFARYQHQDWGDMCAEDKESNDLALAKGDARIVAAYKTSCGKVYIITEWDRSVTTIQFASEY